MLDGFDLLHDLSNVQYRVNAQARTETYCNVIPVLRSVPRTMEIQQATQKK